MRDRVPDGDQAFSRELAIHERRAAHCRDTYRNDQSGAFVVNADADEAAEQAEEEFPDEDLRQVSLTIELRPPSAAPEPFATTVRTRLTGAHKRVSGQIRTLPGNAVLTNSP